MSSDLKPCACGESEAFVGYCRCALVEVARRAALAGRSVTNVFDLPSSLAESVVAAYLSEQPTNKEEQDA